MSETPHCNREFYLCSVLRNTGNIQMKEWTLHRKARFFSGLASSHVFSHRPHKCVASHLFEYLFYHFSHLHVCASISCTECMAHGGKYVELKSDTGAANYDDTDVAGSSKHSLTHSPSTPIISYVQMWYLVHMRWTTLHKWTVSSCINYTTTATATYIRV